MQKKKLLSACIAIALSGAAWATDSVEEARQESNIGCPADAEKLSAEARKKLPAECQGSETELWIAAGATSLVAAFAISELSDGSDSHDVVVPSENGGDGTPTPSSKVTFSNGVTLDKTAKTLTIRDTVFTYSKNADGTYTLTSADKRTAVVNRWQVNEADNSVVIEGTSANGAVWRYDDKGKLIIIGDNTTVKTGDITVDGKGSTGTEIAGNGAVVSQDGTLDVSGGGHGIDITGDSAKVDNKGDMTVKDADSIGIQIDGDKAVVNNDGDSTITNGGTGTQINGGEATVNNNGSAKVDGKDSTGTEIAGDKAVINNSGDSTITNGGTGTSIAGNDATANNTGKTTVDGQGSTGTEIAGNSAVVHQDGTLDVSGGGHGIDITGDSAKVDNKGDMTVKDADSIGIQIDGDKAVVNNDGDSTITNGGTGTQINGNEATVNNNGSTKVDGKDSTGTEIAGDKAVINNSGDSTITNGGTGTSIAGNDATANNTVRWTSAAVVTVSTSPATAPKWTTRAT